MTSNQTYLDLPSTFRSLYGPVAIVLGLLLAGLWLAGYGPGGSACRVAPLAAAPAMPDAPKAPAAAVAGAVAPVATGAAAAVSPLAAAAVGAVPPVEKLYFALNSTQVSAGAKGQLDKVVAYLKANDSAGVVLSGFHDPKGNLTKNEELALNRARAVRTLLEELGIPRERVEMAKPASTTGGVGDDQEARRVDVSVKG